jgi:RNA polymerase sigma-70 factor (ECF subfamily)
VNDQASNLSTAQHSAAGREAPAAGAISFEDASLVERSRKGDMQAFGSLVAKYQERVLNVVFRLCGRRAEAEELAQEAFLKAMERLSDFRGNSGFYTWLFRIAVNLTVSHRRRAGRIGFRSLTGGEESDASAGDSLTSGLAERREPLPDVAAQNAERKERVFAALDELEEEFRVVVVLRDIEDMDYGQIAKVLELPPGTVKSRLHRARGLLKDKLADLAVER